MRFLIDMNLSPLWVPFIEAAGHQAQHWRDVGPNDAPDRQLLAYADLRGLVLVTQDLDFGMLLAMGGAKTPSGIQFRVQTGCRAMWVLLDWPPSSRLMIRSLQVLSSRSIRRITGSPCCQLLNRRRRPSSLIGKAFYSATPLAVGQASSASMAATIGGASCSTVLCTTTASTRR